jgi:hypothetical protein
MLNYELKASLPFPGNGTCPWVPPICTAKQNLLHAGIHCKLLACQALCNRKNSAQTVGSVVRILLVTASQPVASPVGRMRPSDFHFFRHHKKHLDGKQFAADADMKQAVISWLQRLDTFLLHQDTSLGAMVGQMLTCQYCSCWGLMCTICYLSATYTLTSEHVLGSRLPVA